jgi:hypothetical protein
MNTQTITRVYDPKAPVLRRPPTMAEIEADKCPYAGDILRAADGKARTKDCPPDT